MNLLLTLSLLLCIAMAIGPTGGDEEWAKETIQEWKATIPEKLDYYKLNKLQAMAKEHKNIRALLIKELNTGKVPNRNYTMYVALMLVRIEAREAMPDMFRILQDKDANADARWNSGDALGMFGKPAIPLLVEVSKSSETYVRECAVYSMRHLGPLKEPVVIPLLLEALQDRDRAIRQTAIGSLYSSCPEFGGAHLLDALKHKSPLVRVGVASALIEIKIHRGEAEKALIELLGHDNADVRGEAVRAFWMYGHGKFSKAAVAPLQLALKDKDSEIRHGAVDGLGSLGPKAEPAVGDLIKILREDPVEGVAASAARALGDIGPKAKEAVPALIEALKRYDDVPQSAVSGLGKIGPAARDAIPALEKKLREDSSNYVIAIALKQIRGN